MCIRDSRNITKIHRSVLAFQPYSIEAHRPEHIDHVRCHNRTHYTYGNITVRHFLFDPVGPKTRHNNSKRPVAAAVWPRSSSGATTTRHITTLMNNAALMDRASWAGC